MKIYQKKDLKDFTSFKIGGPADIIAEPKDLSELVKLINFLRKNYIKIGGLGMGDWGLGIGDWAQPPIPNPPIPIPNPQSPIPNPQSPIIINTPKTKKNFNFK